MILRVLIVLYLCGIWFTPLFSWSQLLLILVFLIFFSLFSSLIFFFTLKAFMVLFPPCCHHISILGFPQGLPPSPIFWTSRANFGEYLVWEHPAMCLTLYWVIWYLVTVVFYPHFTDKENKGPSLHSKWCETLFVFLFYSWIGKRWRWDEISGRLSP